MAIKHKDAILEILKKSGPLSGSILKERILAKLAIDDIEYPKSTYLLHLQQLYDEFKINHKTEDNKRIYFIKNFEHAVPGGLLLENLDGRITVPKVLNAFSPKITQGLGNNQSSSDFHFYFEFNSVGICFSLHKDAFPFSLHISRKSSPTEIDSEIIKQYGSRTITLELPITKISSYKNVEKPGHLLIEVQDKDKMTLRDLKATNSASILKIKNLTLESFFKDFSLTNPRTVHSDWMEKTQSIMQKISLKEKEAHLETAPMLILLSSDSFLLIF